MRFLTILALGTYVTAAVAGGRKPTRPLWNQRGPVRSGHDFDSTADYAQHLARDALAGEPHTPFKPDDSEDEPVVKTTTSKASSGLKNAWNKVNNKAREAVELAKAQAAIRNIGQKDVDDEAEAMHNILARSRPHGDATRAKNWSPPPHPASERLGQRYVEEEDGDELEAIHNILARGEHGDSVRNRYWSPPPRTASPRIGQRDVDVEEGQMSEYDRHLASRNIGFFDDEDDESDLAARDADDDDDGALDVDYDEDDLAAHVPLGEEEASSGEPEEDTLDNTPGLTARNTEPEPRRLFHFGQKMFKVVDLVYARQIEDEEEEQSLAERDFLDGTKPTAWAKTASDAPPPRPAHETNGWGRQHGHGHYHHAEPEMQDGPASTKTRNQRRFLF